MRCASTTREYNAHQRLHRFPQAPRGNGSVTRRRAELEAGARRAGFLRAMDDSSVRGGIRECRSSHAMNGARCRTSPSLKEARCASISFPRAPDSFPVRPQGVLCPPPRGRGHVPARSFVSQEGRIDHGIASAETSNKDSCPSCHSQRLYPNRRSRWCRTTYRRTGIALQESASAATDFPIVEASITQLQAAMAAGHLSAKDLVQAYLKRIQQLIRCSTR